MTSAIRFHQIATREEGAGVPVVLLHGSASDSRQWRSLTGWISGRYRVIAPDLPGYGGSHRVRRGATLETLAETLAPMLTPGAPVHLVGHGFGGAVALKAACMFPGHVRSLTLIEPTASGPPAAMTRRRRASSSPRSARLRRRWRRATRGTRWRM